MMKVIALVLVLSAVVALGVPQKPLVAILDGKIVGGIDTTIEDHPYQISLLRYNRHFCGGAIISSTWIVTAGHCIHDHDNFTSIYSIRVGSSTINSGGTVHTVSSIDVHPQYNGLTYDFDIAVIQLSAALQFSNSVQPISLAPAGPGPVEGSTAVITGWGRTTEGGTVSTVLQEVDVPIVSQADCRLAYQNAKPSEITDRMFCTGILGVGGKDSCNGDSGGPVVVEGLLTGVVSWGVGCAQPNFPGIKTNIPNLRGWILEKTGV